MFPAMNGQFLLYRGDWQDGNNLRAIHLDFRLACKVAHSCVEEEGQTQRVTYYVIWVDQQRNPIVHFQFNPGELMPQIIDPSPSESPLRPEGVSRVLELT